MVLQHHQGFLKFSQSEGMSIYCHYLQEKRSWIWSIKEVIHNRGWSTLPASQGVNLRLPGGIFFCSKCILFFTELDFFFTTKSNLGHWEIYNLNFDIDYFLNKNENEIEYWRFCEILEDKDFLWTTEFNFEDVLTRNPDTSYLYKLLLTSNSKTFMISYL